MKILLHSIQPSRPEQCHDHFRHDKHHPECQRIVGPYCLSTSRSYQEKRRKLATCCIFAMEVIALVVSKKGSRHRESTWAKTVATTQEVTLERPGF